MEPQWEYCTLVATSTNAAHTFVFTLLRTERSPAGRSLAAPTLGTAIAQLGSEGWEMCGCYAVNFPGGMGQQFFFKRLLHRS